VLLLIVTFFTMLVVGAHMQFNFLHGTAIFTAGDEWLPMFPISWALSCGHQGSYSVFLLQLR
jgi:hypothetical protein